MTRACIACGLDKPLDAEHFHHLSAKKSGFVSRCKACVRGGIRSVRPGRPQRARRLRRVCWTCHGLAHRRPVTGCPKCGGAYAEEPPVRAVDCVRQSDRRELA